MEERFLEVLKAVVLGSISVNDAEALFRAELAPLTQKQKDRAFAEVSNLTGRVTTMAARLHGCVRNATR